jgi:hypothetical protein
MAHRLDIMDEETAGAHRLHRPSVLNRVHLAVGLLGVLVFLGTGQYMDRSLDHLVGMADAARSLYRSGHIYILFAALLHLLLGGYLTLRQSRSGRGLQYVASLLLCVALVAFTYSFVVETPLGVVDRPGARLGIELSLAGTLLHSMTAVLFQPLARPPDRADVRVMRRRQQHP